MSARNFGGMRRIPQRGVIAGVCAGVAEYFDWNVRLLRALLVIVFLFSGFFPIVIVYCVLWYVLDEADRSAPAAGASPHSPAPEPPGRRPTMTDVQARFERLDQRLRSIEECVTDKEFELRREFKKLEA